jgi:uncharacterized cupin superfamily protein
LNNYSVYVLVQAAQTRVNERIMGEKIIQLSSDPAGFGELPDTLDAQIFDSQAPVQHTHMYYEDEDNGVYVGVWDTTSMVESAGPYPCNEFMWLIEGEAAIENSETGEAQIVRTGEAFVIPRGYDCRWRQRGYLRKFFVILEPPSQPMLGAPVVAGIIKPATTGVVASADQFPLLGVAAAQLPPLSPTHYCDSTGQFCAGSWTGQPFDFESVTVVDAVFVYLLEGFLSLQEEGNQRLDFGPGDAFFVPAGTVCSGIGQQQIHLCYAKVRV